MRDESLSERITKYRGKRFEVTEPFDMHPPYKAKSGDVLIVERVNPSPKEGYSLHGYHERNRLIFNMREEYFQAHTKEKI